MIRKKYPNFIKFLFVKKYSFICVNRGYVLLPFTPVLLAGACSRRALCLERYLVQQDCISHF